MVGTAIGGPFGAILGNLASKAFGEGEFEDEYESEEELEYESELEYEMHPEAPMAEHEAMAEMMAGIAAESHTEAEAEAMFGAATMTVLSPRDRAALRRLLPRLVRGAAVLTAILRRRRATRPAVRVVPSIVARTAKVLARRAAAGKPQTPAAAARIMRRQIKRVLGNPTTCGAAIIRNLRGARKVRLAHTRRRSRP
jgi:hypothetical protein